MGVKELETATGTTTGLYYGYKPKDFASIVNDLGMKWIGNHVSSLLRAMPATPNNADLILTIVNLVKNNKFFLSICQ